MKRTFCFNKMITVLLAVFLVAICFSETGFAAEERFVDNGNGTVTDSKTGLMWSVKDNGNDVTYDDAEELCKESALAGYSDWRLPDIQELSDLYDDAGKNKKGFGITKKIQLSECCQWSSYDSTGVSSMIDFRNGKEIWSFKTDSEGLRVLQVREIK